MNNTLNDLSILTTIPEKTLAKFFRKMSFCICESVREDALDDSNVKDITEIDIGIGKLYIRHVGTDIEYRFKPSDYLAKALIATVTNKENPLSNFLDASLGKKFVDLYKDLC